MPKPPRDDSEFDLYLADNDYALWTPAFNSRLEGLLKDEKQTLPVRCESWALRWSGGNKCKYVCFRESPTSKPVRTAIDGAREMRLNERSVQRYFAGQIKGGWYAPDCGQMLVPSRVRGTVLVQMELETPTYAEMLAEWAEKFPDLATELQTCRAGVERIRKLQLAYYREVKRSAGKPTRSGAGGEAVFGASRENGLAPDAFSAPHNIRNAREEEDRVTTIDGQSVSPGTDRPTDSPPPTANHTSYGMQALLTNELNERFPRETVGRTLALRCIEKLADTPWEEFRLALREEKRWDMRKDVMGHAMNIAADVRSWWLRTGLQKHRQEEQRRAEHDSRNLEIQEQLEREQAEYQEADRRWEAMDPAEQESRMEVGRQEIRKEGRWERIPPDVRDPEAQARAKKKLRAEIHRDKAQGAG